jgi:hypothetical protein
MLYVRLHPGISKRPFRQGEARSYSIELVEMRGRGWGLAGEEVYANKAKLPRSKKKEIFSDKLKSIYRFNS